VKQERADSIMELQSGISYELNQLKIGQTFKTLIDRAEGNYFIGRTEFDSPEVDNEVLLNKSKDYVRIGDFVDVRIDSADHFDLFGSVVG
jgi:ribosomal protein S12 methylthiotransferase